MSASSPRQVGQKPTAPAEPVQRLDRRSFTYSIVVPVYNSVGVVGQTVDRIIEVFETADLAFELILVNDGSRDGSWEVISARASSHPHVIALDLLRNYGQHHANLAGFREARGDYVITMDDDLQNPPDQALVLIDAAMAGHDVVFGKFERQAAGYRRMGSKVITQINRRVFGQPLDLEVSNFRILRRDVVDRICSSRTANPYITGQALLYSSDRANVPVRHAARTVGTSSYGLVKIVRLVLTILFSYSVYPLRLAAMLGFVIAGVSFLLGAVYLFAGAFGDTNVRGWTTLVVLLAMFNGVTIALLSMLGEYIVRTLNTVSSDQPYHVVRRVSA